MQCPFLRETLVESCSHSLVRKLIVRNPENLPLERCSSRKFGECALFATAPEPDTGAGHCPYLEESLMQYCGAAPVPKFIPFSEAVLSRCGSTAHRYCELFITMAHPRQAHVPEVDGMLVPEWLHYTPNHMWLDISDDGVCHIGIDALLARTMGEVDRITYLTPRGVHHPAVMLSAGTADFHMVFPNRIFITSPNAYLRANPRKLASDPYRLGWLFECRLVNDGPLAAACGSVLKSGGPIPGLYAGGDEATRWMQAEYHRLGAFVHAQAGAATSTGADVLLADGGNFAPGLVRHIDREQAARLHHAFFSPAGMR